MSRTHYRPYVGKRYIGLRNYINRWRSVFTDRCMSWRGLRCAYLHVSYI